LLQRRSRLATLLLATALSSCSLLSARSPLPPGLPLLAPAALGAPRAASQTLNVAFGKQELDLQTAVQANSQALTLIALGPLGQRAFTLVYDGRMVKSDITPEAAAALPKQFPPERVLADLQLALWPLAAWQARLAGGDWQLSEPQPGLRRLRWRGQLVAEVHSDMPGDPWNGQLWLSNLAYGYTLTIRSQTQ
jgi:hypothetical protein